jgi:predicted dehydrogenase
VKQVIRRGLKEITVDDVPDPEVVSGHILIRPIYSLISSGTETASIHQENVVRTLAENPSHVRKIIDALKVQSPYSVLREVRAKFSEYAPLGYAGAGIVVDKPDDVGDLQFGDRVAYGGERTGHGETIVTGRNLVVRVPDSVGFEDACFSTLGSIALNTTRIANIGLGESVAIVGLGLVGQLAAQLARLQGAVVIGLDLRQERADLAKKLGAEHAWSGEISSAEAVRSVTNGRGADCVIIAAAGKTDAACRLAVDICRDRGRIVDVGAVELNFPWNEMYLKEIQFFMARAYGPGSYDAAYEKQGTDYPLPYVRWTENRNMAEILRLISRGELHVKPLVTHQFELADAERAYDTILHPNSCSLAVTLRYPSADDLPTAIFAPKRKIETSGVAKNPGEIGVALVGAGNLARWAHLPNLKTVPGVNLRAIYSADGVRGKSYALRFGAAYCCTEYDAILQDPDIQVVVIASRNQAHAQQAVAALRAGKDVFVEKPMALTEDECCSIVRAQQETGRQLTVGFNRRFAPYYVELKKRLQRRSGPAVINCRINSPGISGSYWMADPSIGGAILGEACHFVDLMYWLLESEAVSVAAFSLPQGKKDPIGENNLAASFRFADGSVANLTYCTVGSRTSGGERLEVFAPGLGAMTEDFKRLAIRASVASRKSRWFPDKGYQNQMRAFFLAIKKGESPSVTARDGARATITCLRMMQSARELAEKEIHWQEVLL